ncbi:hypothetical protein AKJ09_07667 [Labilithrix luteola]|uniref:Uncharacterized protein n=1 Tax=Labilithrix luteola TaxID=1391654 RepID=A0A0K1Q5K5_9BACT|nr:hypothetical protein AKJ09_07667 [Labilithrix luteola]
MSLAGLRTIYVTTRLRLLRTWDLRGELYHVPRRSPRFGDDTRGA